MSSATSIDPSTGEARKLGGAAGTSRGSKVAAAVTEDPGLRPWQFFLLAGMLAATAGVIVATGQSPASIIVLSVTVVAASLVALGAYRSLSPLVLPDLVDVPAMVGGRTRAALEREKALVLRSIKELEFDFAMGKIAQSDFDELGARLRTRAMGLMRQLDTGGYSSAIEQELKRRLGGASRQAPIRDPRAVAIAADVPESLPEPTATADGDAAFDEDTPASGVTCTCGTVNDEDARFCKSCGTRLASAS
jgi:hypothetical protein